MGAWREDTIKTRFFYESDFERGFVQDFLTRTRDSDRFSYERELDIESLLDELAGEKGYISVDFEADDFESNLRIQTDADGETWRTMHDRDRYPERE